MSETAPETCDHLWHLEFCQRHEKCVECGALRVVPVKVVLAAQ